MLPQVPDFDIQRVKEGGIELGLLQTAEKWEFKPVGGQAIRCVENGIVVAACGEQVDAGAAWRP
jgi:hypothetical protein